MESTRGQLRVQATNIGGISDTTVGLDPGVSILVGDNATNRTSFLNAVRAAMGSTEVPLKGDAEEGEVHLQVDDNTYTRRIVRQDGRVRYEGTPYTDDPEDAELFAFLLEDNEARRAVASGDSLRDVIMRPVDTAEIRRQIRQERRRRQELDDRVAELEAEQERLPQLEEEAQRLREQREELQAEIDEKRAELEDLDGSVSETEEAESELDEAMASLHATKAELDDLEYDLETERQSKQALLEEQEELEDELESTDGSASDRIAQLDAEISELRDHRQSIKSTLSQLQQIIQFNEDILEGETASFGELTHDGNSSSTPTDELVDDSVVCWTCGSEVERSSIRTTVEEIRDLHQQKANKRQELGERLTELTQEQQSIESTIEERDRLERRLEQIRTEIEARSDSIERLETQIEDTQHEVDRLDDRVEELEQQTQSEVLSVHKEINSLEFNAEQVEDRMEEKESEISRIESDLDELETLSDERAEVEETLSELRNRVDNLEQQAVDAFNDHMESILDLLEYDNLERVWIQRRSAGTGSQVTETEFNLQVVRRSDSGAVYEDSVDHLSESEREVIGLVFALAGYLAHRVYESMPFMLLDSLEAIDADRIARLVEYFAEYPDYVVVALLKEDAQALSDEYRRIQNV